MSPSEQPAKQRKTSSWGKIVATYPYRDKNGKLIGEVVRFDPKDFKQRRPNPQYRRDVPYGPTNRKWLWNLTGVRFPPYRLPELIKALEDRPDRWVFVAEGEKDVDNIRSCGLVATTNSGGASRWTDEHSRHLTGCKVAVIPDEDAPSLTDYGPGLHHAEKVCKSLHGVAREVRLLRLPLEPGQKDASDLLRGVGRDRFRELLKMAVRLARPWTAVRAESVRDDEAPHGKFLEELLLFLKEKPPQYGPHYYHMGQFITWYEVYYRAMVADPPDRKALAWAGRMLIWSMSSMAMAVDQLYDRVQQ